MLVAATTKQQPSEVVHKRSLVGSDMNAYFKTEKSRASNTDHLLVAQRIAHWTSDPKVVGSSPIEYILVLLSFSR